MCQIVHINGSEDYMNYRVCCLIIGFLGCTVAADELYVNCGNEGDYETIQAAINVAVNGDEIIVCPDALPYTNGPGYVMDTLGKELWIHTGDEDGDGVLDDEDSDDNNPYQCSDNDGDTCDDCSTGTYNPSDDGWDYDGDGLCDAGDMDDDNDGSPDPSDSDDNNEFVCSDTDFDSCDDCSSGYYDPENDENDSCMYMQGDLNLDDTINIVDVVILVNIILENTTPTDIQSNLADMNYDGNINISDIILLIGTILS